MNSFFNRELLYRIISVIIFIPLVLLPLIYSYYLSIVIYLLFTSIILFEINQMRAKVSKVYIFNIYILVVIISFYLFLLLLISEKVPGYLLFAIIVIIWMFDTFSFIGGKIIGGKKLMPRISSGKTVSGLAVGTVLTLLLAELIANFLILPLNLPIIFTILIVILSFIGDTSVSLLKRYASIKDSGIIMPGHGGLLDRFDSFIMVFFIYGISNLVI